ncbi:hypothetical protein [Methylobacterium sp. WL6]|uniref:hypothetical protein n=1 Tax=Methylobacterium sp. WL6 TaxID=2603901 RepID=UPI0011C75269|nr:hypothetical protein [Methylobacterium sp. WL6]TXN72700.1 hypothetical protein FV230_03960 [Methylobacterium sp. WL6]
MIPTFTIRPRDYVESHVTMRSPREFSRPDWSAGLALRASTEIAADRDAAVAERSALEAGRTDLMLTGTVDDVADLEHRIAVAKVRIDQAEMQHAAAVIAEAKAKADHEAEQTRRRALRKQAMKASAEVGRMANDYLAAAGKLVTLLGQIRERERLIAEANGNLPHDAEAVPPGEPFNGKAGTPSRHETTVEQIYSGMGDDRRPTYRKHPTTTFTPSVPEEPHKPLSARVYLPGLGRDAAPLWGVRYYVNGEPR